MWYLLFIKNKFNETVQRTVYVKNDWDLMAVIGYIHSSSTIGIDTIYYCGIKQNVEIDKKTNELIIFYQSGSRRVKIYDYLLTKIKNT